MHKQYVLNGRDGSPGRPLARPAVAFYQIVRSSRELFAETQSAQTKKQIRHHNKH